MAQGRIHINYVIILPYFTLDRSHILHQFLGLDAGAARILITDSCTIAHEWSDLPPPLDDLEAIPPRM
jgi:hypothetical protein